MTEPDATSPAYPPREHRRRVLKGASIVTAMDRSHIPAIIKNMNENGAGLCIPAEEQLPAEFLLWIPTDHIGWRCHLRWRHGDRAGVSFHGSQRTPWWRG